ncbi:hypothetical protein D0809_00450 [Flavobacterium circumlabens]|uniref:Lipoprotein n=1 Tax=Flavobacterium circumlabens TaxID=2133765 RepID=A0A4Y7UGN2_9FLAO|nr:MULTISPECIES: hypothetical protein [Flavobacterium]QSB26584.1 hypothetical protein HAV12_019815 [Flavobacterium sp. CLA17]TCN52554.1 hypothetical protein EV142_11093 [Flavobacterium circumlabens]TEB45516.1 hypothetical protein D0809_00450 [Flavobacterium circumlabens]
MIKLKKVIIIGVAILSSSCNKKDEVVKPKKEHNTNKRDLVLHYHENYFKKLRKEMDKIEISLYKIKDTDSQDTTKLVRIDRILDVKKIKEFDSLFDSTRNGGYCCCPQTHYIIDLFKQKKRLKRFNVDTLRVKDKAFIFDTSYQTSYIIPLNVWNNFISDSRVNANNHLH